jgi:WD40 repeat protein
MEKSYESFAIHATKVSQLVTMPYAHGTELMVSSGFDGGLTFFVFDKNIPLTASVSSRVRFKGHRSWITGFAIDENKRTAYSISNDRTIKVWPLEINKLLTN